MKAAEILIAVERAGATLRVQGNSLVASNASKLAPAIKTAIREHKPELLAALAKPVCIVCNAAGNLWHFGEALVHQECAAFLPKPESAEPSLAHQEVFAQPDGSACIVSI